MRAALTLILALGLAPGPAAAAPETLIIYSGRDAQRLHCAALLSLVAQNLGRRGRIPIAEEYRFRDLARQMTEPLPGSPATHKKALIQRATALAASHTLKELLAEYRQTQTWCAAEFLN
ncbi:MAG: hypothetical protein IE922_03650 [Sphingomonadales bacterium]|nr:hypothetical protein [Sphingomonadales bacterium]